MDTNGLGAFKQYIWNLLLACDQWINVILLGSVDETVSSRLGRAMLSGKQKWFVPFFYNFVNDFFRAYFNQENHCMESIENPNAAYSELWSWIKDEE